MPRVIAVLKPPKSHPKFLFYAKHIAESVGKSPYFPPPFAPLAPLEADIPALEAAMTRVATGVNGAAEARDAQRYKVKYDLDVIVVSVQRVADGYPPDEAPAVILSAGLAVKKVSAPAPRQDFQVGRRRTSGSTAPTGRPGSASRSTCRPRRPSRV